MADDTGDCRRGLGDLAILAARCLRSRPDGVNQEQPDVTPRGRLVALSKSTRNALAARFGTTWRAKTTEELAAEPLLAEVLGPEPLRDLIEFLDRIDRLKFATERSNPIRQPLENELADWNPRIAGVLVSKIEARRKWPAREAGVLIQTQGSPYPPSLPLLRKLTLGESHRDDVGPVGTCS